MQGLDPGDALEYAIDVQTAGDYNFDLSIGYPYSSAQTITISINNNVVGTINFAKTGGYIVFNTFSTTISLAAGKQILKLTATNGANSIDWMKFTPTWLSAVHNVNEYSNVSLYPNPVSDKLNVIDAVDNGLYSIYSLEGIKLIESKGVKTINVSELNAGIYLLKCGDKTLKFFKK